MDIGTVPTGGRVSLRIPGCDIPGCDAPQHLDALHGRGSTAEQLLGHQLPFVGDVAVVAVAMFRPRFSAEDEALPGIPGHDVVQGEAVGAVILRRLHNQSVHHPAVWAFVVQMARVVELPEPVHGMANGGTFLSLITGPLVDDDDVEVGLLVPPTSGPGAE